MRAAAIVMPLPRRVDGASLFGKTLETVLAERPCRVIIESAPAPDAACAAPGRARAGRGGAVKALTRLTSFLIGVHRRRDHRADVDAGGGAAAVGIILGVLFIAAGAGRLYLRASRATPRSAR